MKDNRFFFLVKWATIEIIPFPCWFAHIVAVHGIQFQKPALLHMFHTLQRIVLVVGSNIFDIKMGSLIGKTPIESKSPLIESSTLCHHSVNCNVPEWTLTKCSLMWKLYFNELHSSSNPFYISSSVSKSISDISVLNMNRTLWTNTLRYTKWSTKECLEMSPWQSNASSVITAPHAQTVDWWNKPWSMNSNGSMAVNLLFALLGSLLARL